MKRFLVLTVALVVLVTAISFAAGRFGKAEVFVAPQLQRAMPMMNRFAPAWKQPLASVPRYQFREEFTYEKVFEEMNLTKEQAKEILDAINEAKAKLEALEEEYEALRDNAKTMTVYEFRTKMRELNQKRAEIMQQLRERIEKTITLEQLQQLMQCYRFKFRRAQGPLFLDEDFIDALEEYIE